MGAKRVNTLVVDFSVLPKRPDASAVQKFMYEELKFNIADAIDIQFHNVRNCVYVEMVDEATAKRYYVSHHLQHAMTCDKQEYDIPVYVEDEAVNVRIHDLPRHTPNAVIKDNMQPYGKVLSITREVWKNYFPGLPNGVRVVRMRLNQHIPSYLTIDGEITLITYRNQTKTCRFCSKKAHPRQRCFASTSTTNTTERIDTTDDANTTQTNLPSLASVQLQAIEQNNEPSSGQAKEANKTQQQKSTDNNDATDSESDEFITVTNKRRLSTKPKEGNASSKRIVPNHRCQNDGSAEIISAEETDDDELFVSYSPVKTRSQLKQSAKK